MKDLNAVLIVEDELITANSVAELLTGEGFDVTGIATDAEKALSFFTDDKENTPSVILCDINIRGTVNGIELARKLKEITCCEIIFLTAYSDTKTMYKAFDTDPTMYIVKPFNDQQVLSAVHMAFHKYFKSIENTAKTELQLTKREREIAELVMEGCTTRQISEKLFISLETVRTHRRKMLQKNNIHSFSHLVYMLSNQ